MIVKVLICEADGSRRVEEQEISEDWFTPSESRPETPDDRFAAPETNPDAPE